MLAKHALYQLSYRPLKRFIRNQPARRQAARIRDRTTAFLAAAVSAERETKTAAPRPVCMSLDEPIRREPWRFILRKEVIQPQVPLRLPCYDFTPVADPTVVDCLLAVSASPSGKTNSHGVTGGVYKARERIHRGMLIRDY